MGAAARKGAVMITIILIVIAVILFLGVMGDNDKLNKRTYCFGFIACVVAVAATGNKWAMENFNATNS